MLNQGNVGDSVILLDTISSVDKSIYCYSNEHLTVFGSGELYEVEYTNYASYIAAAYQKWGKRLPQHLYGSDWWFMIYDKNTHETFIAVEQHGSVCLYYTLLDNRLYISRSLGIIKKHLPTSPDYSHLLATTLYGLPADTTNTCYKDVFQLAPGRTLTYHTESLKVQRYWQPGAISPRENPDKEVLYEELRELYNQAVAHRLAKAQKPGSMLSGGLDSGSVTSIAAGILASQNKQLYTISHIPKYRVNSSARNSLNDESPHILSVANQYQNIIPKFVDSANSCPIEGIEQFLGIINNVSNGARNLFWMLDIFKHLQEIGSDVCLTGKNGNYLLSYAGSPHFLSVYHPYFLNNPRRIPGKLFRTFIRHNPEKLLDEKLKPSYILPESVSVDLREKLVQQLKSSIVPHTSFTSFLAFRLECENQNHFRNYHELYNHFGVKVKDPTADVRLLEFCISLPNEMFFGQNGETRYLIRKIMHNTMPASVLYEKQKGRQASDIGLRLIDSKKKITATIDTILGNPEFRTLVDIRRLQATTQTINKGVSIGSIDSLHFVKAIMLGLFLENQKRS